MRPFLSGALADAPHALAVLGVAAGAVALLLWLWMLRRLVGRILGRAQRPRSMVGYLVAIVVSAGCAVIAGLALMLVVALAGYRALLVHTRVAEVQCIELAPGKLRLYFVAIEPDGTRGPTQTYDLDGDEWTVGGEVLRFRRELASLGFRPYAGITRVEGRWHRAADANHHLPTAYDLHASTLGVWRWLQRNGTRGPLHWAVAGVHGSAVSQQPDRLAVFDVMLTADGYVLDKRSM
jgi:hypothetical protein